MFKGKLTHLQDILSYTSNVNTVVCFFFAAFQALLQQDVQILTLLKQHNPSHLCTAYPRRKPADSGGTKSLPQLYRVEDLLFSGPPTRLPRATGTNPSQSASFLPTLIVEEAPEGAHKMSTI